MKNANRDSAQCSYIVAPFADDFGNVGGEKVNNFSRDAALIKLGTSIGSKADINFDYQFNGGNDRAFIMAVNPPAFNSLVAEMEVKPCDMVQNTDIFPSFQGQNSSFVSLFNCGNQPRGGNSGAVITNNQGNPIGLFAWEYGIDPSKVDQLKGKYNVPAGSKVKFNVGVNLNCIDFDSQNTDLNWNGCENYGLTALQLIDVYGSNS